MNNFNSIMIPDSVLNINLWMSDKDIADIFFEDIADNKYKIS